MKQITLLLGVFLILGISSYAQDFIYLKDGTLIQGFVREANNVSIVYTYSENSTDNRISINTDRVVKIVYANGYIKEYGSSSYSGSSKASDSDSYFALATGWGISYGGAGVRAQARFGKTMGLGLHGGLGYFPYPGGGGLGWSIGAKFFYYRWLYVNVQGGVAAYESDGGDPLYYGGYSDIYYYSTVIPSVMLGGDFIFGEHFGFNTAFGRSFNRGPDFWSMDLGFVFKF